MTQEGEQRVPIDTLVPAVLKAVESEQWPRASESELESAFHHLLSTDPSIFQKDRFIELMRTRGDADHLNLFELCCCFRRAVVERRIDGDDVSCKRPSKWRYQLVGLLERAC